MPSAIELDREMSGRGLVTVLMESQGADQESLEQFLQDRFPESTAFACVGAWVPILEIDGLPTAALIGGHGGLLWMGNPHYSRLEELIDAELKRLGSGWGETEAERRIRALIYGRQDFKTAAAEIDQQEGDAPKFATLRNELEQEILWRLAAIRTLTENGFWMMAHERAKGLLDNVARTEAWAPRLDELEARFKSSESRAGLAAEKKLISTLEKLAKLEKLDALKTHRKKYSLVRSLVKSVKDTTVEKRVRGLAKYYLGL